MKSTKIIGSFEYVSLPELGVSNVCAKIDTGAYSGALHCSVIKEIKKDGQKKLSFIPGSNGTPVEVKRYSVAKVRSSTGHQVKRFLIDTIIEIDGKPYSIRIGLSDRSDMKFEILIGRRFLREQGMLVDVRINQEYDTDGMNQE